MEKATDTRVAPSKYLTRAAEFFIHFERYLFLLTLFIIPCVLITY